MSSIPIGYGVRYLYDAHLRFWRPGLPVALRIRNYTAPATGYVELGFQYSPTGTMSLEQGFTDICIHPQPEVMEVPLRDIGLNQARLMFGARKFAVSHTFVLKRMREMEYKDTYQVWRDPSVVGLYYNKRLFNIESITHDEYGGQTLVWTLLCNAAETLVDVKGS